LFTLFATLVSIFAIISFAVGIQNFQELASQKDPIAIGTILGIVIIVLTMARKLGWAESWVPAKA